MGGLLRNKIDLGPPFKPVPDFVSNPMLTSLVICDKFTPILTTVNVCFAILIYEECALVNNIHQ